MAGRVIVEENKQYEFDFSNVDYIWQMSEMTTNSMLSDVDFIAETAKEVLFIEYKNANIQGAVNPDAMLQKITKEDFYKKIARKFYDSLFLFWACKRNEQELPIAYILIIEHPMIDKTIRKRLKLKIGNQLPLRTKHEQVVREVLSKFEVYNMEEWTKYVPEIEIRLINEK